MIFRKTLYREDNLNIFGKIESRVAVRGIIINKSKLLMLYSKRFNHYEFPGGGVKNGESFEDAVKREVQEETGYEVKTILGKAGYMIEYDKSRNKTYDVYKRKNVYFYLEISKNKSTPRFEKDEIIYEYEPRWIKPEKVILEYNRIIDTNLVHNMKWILREKYVIEKIVKHNKIFE
jgi:8-oxo-dGTP pyrophosphatase MutT (NUDIX family)